MVPKIGSPPAPSDHGHGKDDLLFDQTLLVGRVSQQMQQRLTFKPKPTPIPKETPIQLLLKKIPLLSGFLRNVDHAGKSLSSIAELQGNTSGSLQTAAAGFHWAGLGLNIVDFIRIPMIYGAAMLVGEKPPITLSKNARWLYSAVLLGLTITALALPVTAVPIALTMASLGLGVSLFTMGKAFYERNKLQKELKAIEKDIAAETKELNDLHLKTIELENELGAAEAKNDNARQISALREELASVSKRFDTLFDQSKKDRLDTLYDKKFNGEQQLKKINTASVIDKGIAVALSAIALTGVAIGLFFPPIGLAIVAASALAGTAYLIARAAPTVIGWLSRLFSKKSSTESSEKPAEHANLAPSHEKKEALLSTPSASLQTTGPSDNPVLDVSSTAETMQRLFGTKDATPILQQQIADSQKIETLQSRLTSIVDHHDEKGILTFIHQLSLTQPHLTMDDLSNLFCQIDDHNPMFSLLKHALSSVQKGGIELSEQAKNELVTCLPLVEFLRDQGIDLRAVAAPIPSPETKTSTALDLAAEEEQQQMNPLR